MTFRMGIMLGLLLSISACASRPNPGSWFGSDRREQAEVNETGGPFVRHELVSQVISLNADAHPGGIILHAVGLPQNQGYWAAELVEIERAGGRVVFEFRIKGPRNPTRRGTPRSREVLAGTRLGTQALQGIRTITVQATGNQRSVTRY
ncbi:MAG: hypothetical protein GDA52_03910 [Rhodobacteraceae bacterium]|nr:hypothetical protein [Paracoccaceae bacterium]